MIRPTIDELYTTDLDRHLYTLERSDRDGAGARAATIAARLRETLSTGWEQWKKISVIANFF